MSDVEPTGNKMPRLRNRTSPVIFVITGKIAIEEFKDIQAADKSIESKSLKDVDFVVIRGNRLEKKVTVKYL